MKEKTKKSKVDKKKVKSDSYKDMNLSSFKNSLKRLNNFYISDKKKKVA